MKKRFILTVTFLLAALPLLRAQTPHSGPSFTLDMLQVFGANTNFSADLVFEVNSVKLTGKFYASALSTRFEIGMDSIQGAGLDTSVVNRMKEMGMSDYTTIDRPDLGTTYMVFPGLQSYAPTAGTTGIHAASPTTVTNLGQVMLNGHLCDEKEFIVTSTTGVMHVFIVWCATDLNDFPIKIVTDSGADLLFQNVNLSAPDSSLFGPPAGYKKYDSIAELMISFIATKKFEPFSGSSDYLGN